MGMGMGMGGGGGARGTVVEPSCWPLKKMSLWSVRADDKYLIIVIIAVKAVRKMRYLVVDADMQHPRARGQRSHKVGPNCGTSSGF
jgi:hypothetical protein